LEAIVKHNKNALFNMLFLFVFSNKLHVTD